MISSEGEQWGRDEIYPDIWVSWDDDSQYMEKIKHVMVVT